MMLEEVVLLVNFDPQHGWTAGAPGCGACGGTAWDALAEALRGWDRAGRPATAGIQYGYPSPEAVGSVATEARALFEQEVADTIVAMVWP